MIPVWVVAAAVVGFALGRRAKRDNNQRALILSILEKSGEMTGLDLLASGVQGNPYRALADLIDEGVVACRSDGMAHPERGGQPRYYYRSVRT